MVMKNRRQCRRFFHYSGLFYISGISFLISCVAEYGLLSSSRVLVFCRATFTSFV